MFLKSKMATYPKFANVGDYVEGAFVKYEVDKPGTYGPENLLTLESEDEGTLIIRTTAFLDNLIQSNLETLSALKSPQRIKILLKTLRPSNKGNPMKVFTIEVLDGPSVSRPSVHKAELPDAPGMREEGSDLDEMFSQKTA